MVTRNPLKPAGRGRNKMKRVAIILAAGMGKRMRSQTIKVLHPLAGVPMVLHLVDLIRSIGFDRTVVVVGHQAEKVKEVLSEREVEIVLQPKPLGTGHALLQTHQSLAALRGTLVVLNGDAPLIREETIRALLDDHAKQKASVTVLTAKLADPKGYGRIVRDRSGRITKIVEESEADKKQRAIQEINTGIYALESPGIFDFLLKVRSDNTKGEYYLTDVVQEAIRRKARVFAVSASDANEVMGINSRGQLAEAEQEMQRRISAYWMDQGVTLIQREGISIGASVKIGPDTIIYPQTTLEGKTVIGPGCTIRASHIVDCTLEENVTVKDYCVMEGSVLESGVSVGPFSHLRPGSMLRHGAKVGNFVEMKKAVLGEGSKINHLSYIGDATVGKEVNIGAGTITCNYDGFGKHQTVIGDKVFVGSDTQFVAPVKIGEGALIAAGTTVTEDVPPDALALSRSKQVNKEGWTKKRRQGVEKKPDGETGAFS